VSDDRGVAASAIERSTDEPLITTGVPEPRSPDIAATAGAAGNGAIVKPSWVASGQRRLADAPKTVVAMPRWQARYVRVVIVGDLAVLACLSLAGGVLGLGNGPDTPHIAAVLAVVSSIGVGTALYVTRSWDPRVLGQGSEEFSRLLRAIVASAVLLGLVGLLIDSAAPRYWVFGVIPLVGVVICLFRYGMRRALVRRRSQGRCLHQVLALGTEHSVADLIVRTRRAVYHGWTITGVCTPRGSEAGIAGNVAGVPVVADYDTVSKTAVEGGYRVVAVAPGDGWSPQRLHQLAWDLEGNGIDLVVHPGLMEVAGPRLHVAPVDGLPLLRLTEPTFSGIPRLVKSGVDIVMSVLALFLLAPLLVVLCVAVRLDGGPAFFKQTRVGRGGKTFRMIKFRSMVPDAERHRADLIAKNEGAGPLFKLRQDPRVTRVGRVMRRYSLDELPQLFNVLGGSMSLVGPRPPLPAEVAGYGREARRKLLVKPGLTGLWQVSGRSDLSWEESVRLDLRYVENWTLALDVLIMWKTIRAVLGGAGAY
jgi:exopolysaccharide biosynthesis polyprenyl glycosylphosphotransferase